MYHFWRTIGYCLGMEDRYNLCTGSDEEIKEICKLMYTQLFLPPIQKQSEPTAIAMSQAIALGKQEKAFASFLSFKLPSKQDFPI